MRHKIKLHYHLTLGICLLPIFLLFSCKKYLDAKPDKLIVIPSSLNDLQALLDNAGRINYNGYPSLLEVPTDDYWLSYANWSSRPDYFQKNYIWDDASSAQTLDGWIYGPVFISNTVLDELPKIVDKTGWTSFAQNVRGSALFYRSFSFYNLAQIYCKAYSQTSTNSEPGIPLRLNSDFNETSTRGTVQDTYNRIVNDLKEAISLLPVTSEYKTRPTKPAAFAALARTYLAMEDYTNAEKYADSCLQLFNTLIDYKTLVSNAAIPFSVFNAETIFYSYTGNGILSPTRANVDSTLYKSYADKDLRKAVFFQNNGSNNFGFKGSYAGILTGIFFNGFATDEIYLIRAECYARNGNKNAAMSDLNTLLSKRWSGIFVPYTATTVDDALAQIITERRKELIMRGVRWSDLRRLNRDNRFAKTLKRVLVNGANTMEYTLPPNDLRYVLLIPAEVIRLTGMEQNLR